MIYVDVLRFLHPLRKHNYVQSFDHDPITTTSNEETVIHNILSNPEEIMKICSLGTIFYSNIFSRLIHSTTQKDKSYFYIRTAICLTI